MLHVHGFLVLFSFTLLCLGKFIALGKIICRYYLQAQEVLKEHPRYKKDEKIQGMRNILILGSVEDLNQISSVIRQKGKSQKVCFKKTKQAKFSEKRTFLNP